MNPADFISSDTMKMLAKMNAVTIQAQQHAFNKVEYCATEKCSNKKIQWCHVISESEQMSAISEKGKVCWLPGKADKNMTFRPFWEEVSTKSALVFKGFCNTCDSSIFRKLDVPMLPSPEVFALLAYRAACYSNWRALVDLEYQTSRPNFLQKMSDRDKGVLPPLKENRTEVHGPLITRAALHQKQIEWVMHYMREVISNSNFGKIRSHSFDLKRRVPLRYSVMATFALNLRNTDEFISQIECPPMPALFFHLLEFDGQQKLVLSWPEYVPEKHPKLWVKQILNWSKSGNLSDVLMRYFFLNNHGLVFNPKMSLSWDHEKVFFLSKQLADKNYFGRRPFPTPLFKEPLFNEIVI